MKSERTEYWRKQLFELNKLDDEKLKTNILINYIDSIMEDGIKIGRDTAFTEIEVFARKKRSPDSTIVISEIRKD